MVGLRLNKLIIETRKVEQAVDRLTLRVLYKQAAYVRITAARSIKRSKKPSAVGSPPHTQTGQLKRAIRFEVDRTRQAAIIGPSFDVVGIAGAEHELGKQFRRERHEPRPFMRPALEKARPKFARDYQDTLK